MPERVGSSGGKRPGKQSWAARRRPVTRRSGYEVHPETTGSELRVVGVGGWELDAGGALDVAFRFPPTAEGSLLGFGLWFRAPVSAEVRLVGFDRPHVLTRPAAPNWSKVGSQWYSDGAAGRGFAVHIEATRPETAVALYGIEAGEVDHPHYAAARPALMRNKHTLAPEGNFVTGSTHVEIDGPSLSGPGRELRMVAELHLKSCNRCARFLPINVHDERSQLSYTNHCTSPHRLPCRHPGFSRLRDIENGEELRLHHGFQLECRFCKKFEVNGPHNPLRTAAQMKEDAARRRALQVLLSELYGGDDAVLYRQRTAGRELADDVWERFGRRCFKCSTPFPEARDMHLDHTRPLALLWPLDETATALCATHNSEKRDRAPAEYYDADELRRLSGIIGVPLDELTDTSPNRDAVQRLIGRLDWFFDDFLVRPELQAERDGKRSADLLIKGLQKTLARDPRGPAIDLAALYRQRRS